MIKGYGWWLLCGIALGNTACRDQFSLPAAVSSTNTPRSSLPKTAANLNVEIIPHSESQGYYAEAARGPRYLTLRIQNADSDLKTDLSFNFNDLGAAVALVTDSSLQSPNFDVCPAQTSFSLNAGEECILLFETAGATVLGSRTSFVELYQADMLQNTIVLRNKGGLYAGGDFSNPTNPSFRGVGYFNGTSWTYPFTLIGSATTLATDKRMVLYVGENTADRTANVWSWDGTQSSLWQGNIQGSVETLHASDATGLLYAAGSFTNFDGSSGAPYIVKTPLYAPFHPPVSWSSVQGEALGNTVRALEEASFVQSVEDLANANLQVQYRSPTEDPATNVYGRQTPQVKIFSITNNTGVPLNEFSVQLNLAPGALPTLALTQDPQFFAPSATLCAVTGVFSLDAGASCLVAVQGTAPNLTNIPIGHQDKGSLSFYAQGHVLKSFYLQRKHVLYAGGTFTHAPQADGSLVSTPQLASFDGTSWRPLGTGKAFQPIAKSAASRVNALAVDGWGRLYVGGHFAGVGERTTSNLIRWQGDDAWAAAAAAHDPQTGLNDDVFVLRYQPELQTLLVGGRFTDFQGSTNDNLWKLASYHTNTDTWSTLGDFKTDDAENDAVYAILDGLPLSEVYVAGSFTSVSGTPTNHGARYTAHTNSWSPWLGPVTAPNDKPTYHALAGVGYGSSGTSVNTKPYIYGGGSFQEDSTSSLRFAGLATYHGDETQMTKRGPVGTLPDSTNGAIPPVYALLSYWINVAGTAQLQGIAGGDFSQIRPIKNTETPVGVPANYVVGWQPELRNASVPSTVYPYCSEYYCPVVPTTVTDFGGTNGPVRALLRLFDSAQPQRHGSIYLGGSFSTAGGHGALGVALLLPDATAPQLLLSRVGLGLIGGQVNALANGHVLDLVEETPDLFFRFGLTSQIKPYEHDVGYYVDGLTRGPLFQVLNLSNTSSAPVTNLQFAIDFSQARGRLIVETDPVFYNGRAPCSTTQSFQLNVGSQCTLVVRGSPHGDGLGASAPGVVSLLKDGLSLGQYKFTHHMVLVSGGDFSTVTIAGQPQPTLYTATFDGQTWRPNPLTAGSRLISNDGNTVQSLMTTPAGWVVAGGFYAVNDSMGNLELLGLASWGNNTTGESLWNNMGDTLGIQPNATGSVRALWAQARGAFVGGDVHFNTYQGVSPYWASLENNQWTSAGGPLLNGAVYDFAQFVPDDHYLYVAGTFTQVGAMPLPGVGRFDLNQKRWSVLGGGLNGPVYSLAIIQQLQGEIY